MRSGAPCFWYSSGIFSPTAGDALCAASSTRGSPVAETRFHDFAWRASRLQPALQRAQLGSLPLVQEKRAPRVQEQITVAYLCGAGSRVGSATAQRCPAIVIRRGRRTVGRDVSALASAIDASASGSGRSYG